MNLWAKFALKEIRNNLRFSLFFILNLTLGFVGFIALDSFNMSLGTFLQQNSKKILTADLGIYANHSLSEEEQQIIDRVLGSYEKRSTQIRFFSMVSGGSGSRLAQVIAVDDAHPLYGTITLKDETKLSRKGEINHQLFESQSAWTDPNLLKLMGMQRGDLLKIGAVSFGVSHTIEQDTASLLSSMGMAPRVYIGLNHISQTQLIQPGSRIHYHYYYRFDRPVDLNTLASTLSKELEALENSPSQIRIQTPEDAGQQLGKVLGYLNDYLGLVALVAMFLASMGAAYLFRNFIASRMKNIGIFMSFGATRQQAYQVYLYQVLFLGAATACFASALSLAVFPMLPLLLEGFLPEGFSGTLSLSSLGLSFFYWDWRKPCFLYSDIKPYSQSAPCFFIS